MNLNEALDVCDRWFSYIEQQSARSVEIQRLAAMARNGNKEEAQRLLRQIDKAPTVYDGATLEPAVRELVRLARLRNQPSEGQSK